MEGTSKMDATKVNPHFSKIRRELGKNAGKMSDQGFIRTLYDLLPVLLKILYPELCLIDSVLMVSHTSHFVYSSMYTIKK